MTAKMRTGQAGTLESCDARVIVELTDGSELLISVEGPMKEVFGDAVSRVARDTLTKLNVTGAKVKIVDRGALDYVIEARTKVALARALEGE